MNDKINWLCFLIIILLMTCIGIALGRIHSLEERVKSLEDKTTCIELRLEDTTNNDDFL